MEWQFSTCNFLKGTLGLHGRWTLDAGRLDDSIRVRFMVKIRVRVRVKVGVKVRVKFFIL